MSETVQDKMNEEILESGGEDTNETLELFDFMRNHGTNLSQEQMKGMFLLQEYGQDDLAKYAYQMKQHTVKQDTFFKLLEKLTLSDRIKGNAKLSHLLKASANPTQTALKPEDMQAKGMSAKEIDR